MECRRPARGVGAHPAPTHTRMDAGNLEGRYEVTALTRLHPMPSHLSCWISAMLLMFLVLSPTGYGLSALLPLCSVLQTIAHTCSSILASGISPWPSSSSSASSLATGGGRLMDTPLELGHRPAQGTNMSMGCHTCGCGCIAY